MSESNQSSLIAFGQSEGILYTSDISKDYIESAT